MGNKIVTEADRKRVPDLPWPWSAREPGAWRGHPQQEESRQALQKGRLTGSAEMAGLVAMQTARTAGCLHFSV